MNHNDPNPDIDMQPIHNKDQMPGLQDASDTSDDESLRDANEVEMQANAGPSATQADNTDIPSLGSGSTQNESVSFSPRLGSRRARVEDDQDAERDRRHPTQRIASVTPPTGVGGSAASSNLPQNESIPTPPSHHPIPTDAAGSNQQFHISQNMMTQGPGIPSLSQSPNSQSSTTALPTSNPASTTTGSDTVPPPNGNNQMPQVLPNPADIVGGFAVTIDLLRGMGQPGGPTNQPPARDSATFSDVLAWLGAFGAAMRMGLGGPEQESPERAKKLVAGLEEVPLGLVRRLERVGGTGGGMGEEISSGGDGGCAICWEKLLDEEGFGAHDDPSKEQEEERPNESPVDLSETQAGSEAPEGNKTKDREHPKIVVLPCAHVFHASCLIPWFSRPRQTTCPSCRFNIDPDNLTYNPIPLWQRQQQGHREDSDTRQEGGTENVAADRDATNADGGRDVNQDDRHREMGPMEDILTALGNANPTMNAGDPAGGVFDVPVIISMQNGLISPVTQDGNAQPSTAPPVDLPPTNQTTDPTTNNPATLPDQTDGGNPRPRGFFTIGFDMIFTNTPDGEGNLQTGDEVRDGEDENMENEHGDMDEDMNRAIEDLFFRANRGGPHTNANAQANQNGNESNPLPERQPMATNDNAPTTIPTTAVPAPVQISVPPRTSGTTFTGFNRPLFPPNFNLANFTPIAGQPYLTPPPPPPELRNGSPLDFASIPDLPRAGPGVNLGQMFARMAGPRQEQGNAGANGGENRGRPTQAGGANPPGAGMSRPNGPSVVRLPSGMIAESLARLFGGQIQGIQPGGGGPGGRDTTATTNPETPAAGPATTGGDLPENRPDSTPRPPLFQTRVLPGFPPGRWFSFPGTPSDSNRRSQSAPAQREKPVWAPPPPPGLTLRQRIEKREREAGLRCFEVSCGVGPSDEDPFVAVTEEGMRQLSIHSCGEKENAPVCAHTFHLACLVSAERVALSGEDEKMVVGEEVEVSCPVCRGVGCVSRTDWEVGVQALV